jgi:hypothetical protein
MYTKSYSKDRFHDEIVSVFHDLMVNYSLSITVGPFDGYSLSNGKIKIEFHYGRGEVECTITCAKLSLFGRNSAISFGLLFPNEDLPESYGDTWIPINLLVWHEKLVSKIMTKL